MYSLPHHTHHNLVGWYLFWEKFLQIQIIFCYVTSAQFGNILTLQRPSSYEASIRTYILHNHIPGSYFIVTAVRHSYHALKMILIFILILSCYGSCLLSTQMLYKNPQPCWLLFEELLPAISNNERNCIN